MLPTPERNAAITLVGSASLFAVMALGVRVAAADLPGPEIALVRFVAGALVVLAAMATGHARVRPQRWGWLLARGFFGGSAVFAYFLCIEHAGAGIATLLNYTAPVWSLLFGWWLLGEQPRAATIALLTVTMAGVALVMGGGGGWVSARGWVLLGVFSAAASGMAITSIRAVRRHESDGKSSENSWTVFASFTTLGIFATLPAVLPPFGHWVNPSPATWAPLGLVAATSILAQLLMTRALEHVSGAKMGIIHQLTVVITMTCGVLFFGETITALSLVGSVLTVGGVVGAMFIAAPLDAREAGR